MMNTRIDTNSMTASKNIIITPEGHLVPRTEDNLKKLHKYVKRVFKKNMYDKRTKAYRYMMQHDSEFLRK